MPKSKPAYPPEFRRRMVELVRASRAAPLQRENKTLREERDILKKAAAWFARETNSIPPKDSSS